ncbi:MAG: hypothetical protein RIR49_1723, partial [Actinomycetota bacterium]
SCDYPGCADPILWDGVTARYTITPALPAGVTLNPNTGVIYTDFGSSPSTSQDPTTYTITATAQSPATGTRTSDVTMEILETESIVAKVDTFFWSPRPLADGQGCDTDPDSVTPPLPDGLEIDTYCNIAGEPTEVYPRTLHTITPPNGWGGSHQPAPSEVFIEVIAGVVPDYEIYIEADPAVDDPTPFVGAGWERVQGVSQFAPAGITKVQGTTAVTITGLDGRPVRAAADVGRLGTWRQMSGPNGPAGPPMAAQSDHCPGMNVAERSALSVAGSVTATRSYESIDRALMPGPGDFIEWEWCSRGGYAEFVEVEGEDEVTFVFDIAGANPSTWNAMMQIEVDGGRDGFRVGSGDQIYEINLQPEPLQKCSFDRDTNMGSCQPSVTDDLTAFMADVDLDLVYLDPVPSCSSSGGEQPCVEEITPGWALRLKDSYAEMAEIAELFGFEAPHGIELIPYPTEVPFKVYDGDQVEFTVDLPSGTARGRDWGTSPQTGASIAESGAKFDEYQYAQDSDGATVTSALTARAGTWVFSTGDGAGEYNFNDQCSGNLAVVDGVTFIDEDGDGEVDPGEDDVSGCQNTPGTISTTSILLAPGVGTVTTAEAHGFSAGDEVTMCCVGPPFDGTHTIASVPDDTTFTISTVGLRDEFSGQDLSDADWHGNEFRIAGFVAPGDTLNVPNTRVNMSLQLMAPFGDETVLAGGYVTTNAQAKAFGDSIAAGEAFDFGVAGPSYDADGNYRNDGFFQICMPEPAIEEWFGFDLATAVTEMQVTRDGSLISSGLTSAAATCGSTPGLSIELDPFSFSAPYFKAAPDQVSAGFVDMEPARLLDTRPSGTKVGAIDGTGTARELTVLGVSGVPATGVSA